MPQEEKLKSFNESLITEDGDPTEDELKLLEANKQFRDQVSTLQFQLEELKPRVSCRLLIGHKNFKTPENLQNRLPLGSPRNMQQAARYSGLPERFEP
ncbi:hypothetical protein TKK_0003652 [Trichogramma kaykai]